MYYEINKINQYCVARPYDVIVILSKKKNPIDHRDDFYSYCIEKQFNSSVKNGELYEVALWCEENCLEAWLVGKDISAFVNEIDATAFKLRWL